MNDLEWNDEQVTRQLHAIEVASWKLSLLEGYGSKPLGVRGFDMELVELGASWCRHHPEPAAAVRESGPDVYLATEIYRDGGHTPLIGDFVRATRSIDEANGKARAPEPQVILTACHRPDADFSDPLLCERMAVRPRQLHQLDPASRAAKLGQLCVLLRRLQPRRLFLFHHPCDPIAPAAAQASPTSETLLVHHADSAPCLGLYLPGLRLIDLTPTAAAFGRLTGLNPAWLPLTIEDPGSYRQTSAPAGFWTSCSSGRQAKFQLLESAGTSYSEAVVELLRHGCKRHVHIGGLEPDQLDAIHKKLRSMGTDPARFEHIPWVPSIARALIEIECDWYLDTWPMGGARTRIEVMAAGIPILCRDPVRHNWAGRPPSRCRSEIGWHKPADLADILNRASEDTTMWRQLAEPGRQHYQRLHHPSAFRTFLADILNGGFGAEDPDQSENDRRVRRSMLKALATGFQQETLTRLRPDGPPRPPQGFDSRYAETKWLDQRRDSSEARKLREQLEKQRLAIKNIEAKLRSWEKAGVGQRRGLRRLCWKLRSWLRSRP